MTNNSQYTVEEQEKYRRKLEVESRPLFKAILDLNQPHAYTCAEFEKFIKTNYGKDQRIKPKYLYQWWGEEKEVKVISKWLYAAAIDYLMRHKVNPVTIIPVEKVAEFWARVRTDKITLDEAKQEFIELFKPDLSKRDRIYKIIEAIYNKAEQIL